MKSSNHVLSPPPALRRSVAFLGIAAAIAFAGNAHAAGTASGTTISNQATLTYSVGTVSQTPITSAAATFVVDNRVNVTVATVDAAAVAVINGSTNQVLTFTVTNNGNTVQDFALASAQRANGTTALSVTDNFDTPTCSQFVESGGTAGFQPAQDTADFIDELASDASLTVYVVCSIPASQANNDAAVVTLTATARAGGGSGSLGAALTQAAANTAGVDIVFGDAAGSDDAARDAAHSSRSAFRVATSALAVTKTSTLICDPLNGQSDPKHIPGAVVRWTITIANTGSASASLATVTDAINAATAFDANLITGAGGAAGCVSGTGTPENAAGRGFRLSLTGASRPGTYPKFFTTANDSDGSDLNGSTVTVNYATAMPAEGTYAAGELKTGESVVVSFNVTVN